MSNKKKQNSIDCLVEELRKYIEEPWKYVPKGGKEAIIDKAKAMHKEEIVKAYNQSWHLRHKAYETAEKYYNETFGGNNEQQ
jgi:hypothetical protein